MVREWPDTDSPEDALCPNCGEEPAALKKHDVSKIDMTKVDCTNDACRVALFQLRQMK
jgi:hypothetical protein